MKNADSEHTNLDHRPLNFVTSVAIFGSRIRFFAVETLDHFDRGSHIGRKLKHADALRNPHGGVGVPERVGDALLSIGPAQNSSLIKDLLKSLLKASYGSTVRMTENRFLLSCFAANCKDQSLLAAQRLGA